MEAEFNEQEQEARQEFESTREEIKNKNSEEYNVLRFTLEGLIEELERHFDSAHANYMATTEQRTQDFKNLTIKDQTSARTIEQQMQMRKLQRLQDSLAHWKTKLASNSAKCEERNRAMKEEKDAISRHFQELKGRMNKFREREALRLQELTINSQAAIKTLKARLEKAERIIKLAELDAQVRDGAREGAALLRVVGRGGGEGGGRRGGGSQVAAVVGDGQGRAGARRGVALASTTSTTSSSATTRCCST